MERGLLWPVINSVAIPFPEGVVPCIEGVVDVFGLVNNNVVWKMKVDRGSNPSSFKLNVGFKVRHLSKSVYTRVRSSCDLDVI